jgi:hypothetical protein
MLAGVVHPDQVVKFNHSIPISIQFFECLVHKSLSEWR